MATFELCSPPGCVDLGAGVIVVVYGFTTISAALAYPLLTGAVSAGDDGACQHRIDMLMFGCSFVFQWGIGAVLRLYPVTDGRYSPEGYATALLALTALQVAVLAWLLPLKEAR